MPTGANGPHRGANGSQEVPMVLIEVPMVVKRCQLSTTLDNNHVVESVDWEH